MGSERAASQSGLEGPSTAEIVELPQQRTAKSLTVSAVVPTLNEAKNLRWLLPQLAAVDEVIIIDGQSTDGTRDVVRELCPQAVFVSQKPRGKGAALRAGFALASCDVIVMLDADGSMDPGEIDGFLALIERGFDVVKGSRYACGGGSDDLDPLRRQGNRWLTRVANMLYQTEWSDLCYGYIALRRSAIDRLGLWADGFEIETQLCVSSVSAGLRVAEVPSHELARRFGDSNLRTFRDGSRVLATMLLHRMSFAAFGGWS